MIFLPRDHPGMWQFSAHSSIQTGVAPSSLGFGRCSCFQQGAGHHRFRWISDRWCQDAELWVAPMGMAETWCLSAYIVMLQPRWLLVHSLQWVQRLWFQHIPTYSQLFWETNSFCVQRRNRYWTSAAQKVLGDSTDTLEPDESCLSELTLGEANGSQNHTTGYELEKNMREWHIWYIWIHMISYDDKFQNVGPGIEINHHAFTVLNRNLGQFWKLVRMNVAWAMHEFTSQFAGRLSGRFGSFRSISMLSYSRMIYCYQSTFIPYGIYGIYVYMHMSCYFSVCFGYF